MYPILRVVFQASLLLITQNKFGNKAMMAPDIGQLTQPSGTYILNSRVEFCDNAYAKMERRYNLCFLLIAIILHDILLYF